MTRLLAPALVLAAIASLGAAAPARAEETALVAARLLSGAMEGARDAALDALALRDVAVAAGARGAGPAEARARLSANGADPARVRDRVDRFMAADADGDGAVTRAEFDAHAARKVTSAADAARALARAMSGVSAD